MMDIMKQNIKLICRTWTRCIGIFASILSVILLFWSLQDMHISATYDKVILIFSLCIIAFVISIIWVCCLKKSKVIWKNPSGVIKVCYSDIIKEGFDEHCKEKKLIVIPVNTCFDTIVDSDITAWPAPLVSPNSLHGKWIDQMIKKCCSIQELDAKIDESLNKRGEKSTYLYKERGKNQEYKLGTIATIRGNENTTFLLLAMSRFDEKNVAHTSVDDLQFCIKKLVNFNSDYGQGYKLMIPLMGTNLSRAGLTHGDSLRIITSLFMIYGDKIHGEVDVVIYEGDRDKVTLDI